MPFAFVNIQCILLVFFVLLSPIVIACFVGGNGEPLAVTMAIALVAREQGVLLLGRHGRGFFRS